MVTVLLTVPCYHCAAGFAVNGRACAYCYTGFGANTPHVMLQGLAKFASAVEALGMHCDVTPVPGALLARCRHGREELGEGNTFSFFRVYF